MPSRVTLKKRLEIVARCQAGVQSHRAIGRALKVKHQTVAAVFKKFQETGDVRDFARTGRPSKTTSAQDKELIHIARRHDEEPSTDIADRFQQRTGTRLAASSVRRHLVAAGLEARPFASKPALTEAQKAKRLSFAHDNRRRRWGEVLFSDETKIALGSRKRLVRRFKGEKKYKRTFKHPGSVNVWGCFGRRGFGSIHIFRENLTGELYRDILNTHLRQSAAACVPARWVFQDDNDPKHRSRVAKQWLATHKIRRLDWPPNSPDANPIENVWRPLKDNVAARRPKNLDQLERYIREEWDKFTPDYAATLVGSMPNRISELIKQNGDVIQY